MKVHPITHNEQLVEGMPRQVYCGPAAISAITGRSAECASVWINHLRGDRLNKTVRSTGYGEVSQVLQRLGYFVGTTRRLDGRKTLAAWLRSRTEKERGELFLVAASEHWFVVAGNTYACSVVGRVPTSKAYQRRAIIESITPVRAATTTPARAMRSLRLDPLPEPVNGHRLWEKRFDYSDRLRAAIVYLQA